jgi:hypothetical protein
MSSDIVGHHQQYTYMLSVYICTKYAPPPATSGGQSTQVLYAHRALTAQQVVQPYSVKSASDATPAAAGHITKNYNNPTES